MRFKPPSPVYSRQITVRQITVRQITVRHQPSFATILKPREYLRSSLRNFTIRGYSTQHSRQ